MLSLSSSLSSTLRKNNRRLLRNCLRSSSSSSVIVDSNKQRYHLHHQQQQLVSTISKRYYNQTTVVFENNDNDTTKKISSKQQQHNAKDESDKKNVPLAINAVTDTERNDNDDDGDIITMNDDNNIDTTANTATVPLSSSTTTSSSSYTKDQLYDILQQEEARLNDEIQSKFVKNWQPGYKKRPLQISYSLDPFKHELNEDDNYERPYTLLDKRCGGLGIKVGMVPIYDPIWGQRYPCTVIYMDQNLVLQHKTIERHGYRAIQIGAGERKIKNVTKSVLGQYQHILNFHNNIYYQHNRYQSYQNRKLYNPNTTSNALSTSTNSPSVMTPDDHYWKNYIPTHDTNIYDTFQNDIFFRRNHADNDLVKLDRMNPPYITREFRISHDEYYIPIGTNIHAMHFIPGQNVDITGISKGKGFQGGMKRHGFKGMPASHGVSVSHRAIGSVGQCQDPGKVFKGKKMPGRMGSDRVTVQNKRILKIDRGRNLLYIIGGIPGQNGNYVEIKDSVKKPLFATKSVLNEVSRPPLPTYYPDNNNDNDDDNNIIDGSGISGHEVYMPMPMIDPLLPYED